MGPKKVPYIITHDARTIRYPNPHIKANDTIRVDIATGKIEEHIKFDTGILTTP
jgi:small subunit ribosomal protein S4e